VPVADDIAAELATLEASGLLRRPIALDAEGDGFSIEGRPIRVFCSNDYLGLAAHPALADAAHRAIDRLGVGGGASRLISGTRPAHLAAERRLAALVDQPAALLFSSGYAANLGALTALLDRGDVAFSDRLCHASLIDGLRLSRATVHVYEHADPSHLAELLERHRGDGRRAWVVTDTVFSMDGDLAPLRALRDLCDRHDAGLFVDEAHAVGVLGGGHGLCAARGVRADVTVGTLGKAAGVAGAFVAGSPELRTFLENRARSYVFSTATPPALAEVARAAADLIEAADDRRARLAAHGDRLRTGLRALGADVPAGEAPIVPVLVGDPQRAMAISARLLDAGFFVRAIRPPTVPDGTSRLRVVATAGHSEADVNDLLAAFATALDPGPR
jgi:8-amino-7-oxononanoate synthase